MLRATFFGLCMAILASAAPAKTWDQAILDVTALADRYAAAILAQTGDDRLTALLGSVHSVQDMEMHMCAILGRRFGHVAHIGHLEPPQPPLDSPWEVLLDNYASLQTWIRSAQSYAGMSHHQRAQTWNIECVGQYGIPANLGVPVPREVFFERDRSYLWIYGDIVPGFDERLEAALDANPGVETIAIGSGGGSVSAAIFAGLLIRERGLRT